MKRLVALAVAVAAAAAAARQQNKAREADKALWAEVTDATPRS